MRDVEAIWCVLPTRRAVDSASSSSSIARAWSPAIEYAVARPWSTESLLYSSFAAR
jgi:hypothetical protein